MKPVRWVRLLIWNKYGTSRLLTTLAGWAEPGEGLGTEAGMEFRSLLEIVGVAPDECRLMRHVFPHRPGLLQWLAAEHHDEFNAFQSSHSLSAERSLSKAKYFASFVATTDGRTALVGLYQINGSRPITYSEFQSIPDLAVFLRIMPEEQSTWREGRLWFELEQTDLLAEYSGRLLVDWPVARAYVRRADTTSLPVTAILEQSALVEPTPDWRDMVLDLEGFRMLPAAWKAALAHWRGVYHIEHLPSRRGYVGSASGEQNIYGRWLSYATTGHGGNVELRGLDPADFRFSVLERLSPDATTADTIAAEYSWKRRLHTLKPHGLNAN